MRSGTKVDFHLKNSPSLFNRLVISDLYKILDSHECDYILLSAYRTQKLEINGVNRVNRFYDKLDKKIIDQLIEIGRVNSKEINFDDIIVNYIFKVVFASINDSKRFPALPKISRLARPKIPLKLSDLLKQWDLWRKKKIVPKQLKTHVKNLKESYLKKIHNIWSKSSEDFRSGDPVQKEEIITRVREELKTERSRAANIVQTETTKYYNNVRRKVFDESEEVTHYLFLSIRDKRTTAWCKTRHGIVFEKGTKLLEENTPAIHWNCRSEITPLTPFNPKHKKLIDDSSRKPSNNKLKPLPHGWSVG